MKIQREFILGNHTLNPHDLSDGLSIDIRRRNFMVRPLCGSISTKNSILTLTLQLYMHPDINGNLLYARDYCLQLKPKPNLQGLDPA